MRWVKAPDWSDEHARLLHETLCAAYQDKADLKAIWRDNGLDLSRVDWDGSVHQLWPALTRDAFAEGKLEQLICRVRDLRPVLAGKLQRVLDAEVAGPVWYVCHDRYRARLVGPGLRRSLVDRSALSSRLREMVEEEYPVLSITGQTGSGKSHSRHLMRHVLTGARLGEALRILDVAREWPEESREVGLVEFATRLAMRLGITHPDFAPDQNTGFTTTARELGAAFVGRFGALPRTPRWIFLDGLDRPQITGPVHMFVGVLAEEVEAGQLFDTRLIVTGHPGDFAPSVLDVLLEEEIEPIGERHLRGFFSDIAHHLGVTLDPDALDRLVEEVLDRAAMADLGGLGQAAGRVARRHFATAGRS